MVIATASTTRPISCGPISRPPIGWPAAVVVNLAARAGCRCVPADDDFGPGVTTGNRLDRLFGVTVVPGSGLRVVVGTGVLGSGEGLVAPGDGVPAPTTAVTEAAAWDSPGAATATVTVTWDPAFAAVRIRAATTSLRVLFARSAAIRQSPDFGADLRVPGQAANFGVVTTRLPAVAVARACLIASDPRAETEMA